MKSITLFHKNTPLILLFLIGISTTLFAQKVVRNTTDNFTGEHVVETSWETLYNDGGSGGFIRYRKVDSLYFMDVRVSWAGDTRRNLTDGNTCTLTLGNGEKLEFVNHEEKQPCNGCGSASIKFSNSLGMEANYTIDKETLKTIRDQKIVQIHFNTSDGYFDKPIVKRKWSKVLSITQIILSF